MVGVVPIGLGLLVWLVATGLGTLILGLSAGLWFAGPIAATLSLAAALLVRQLALKRLTAVTGDVLGACVESAATVFLVTVAVVA